MARVTEDQLVHYMMGCYGFGNQDTEPACERLRIRMRQLYAAGHYRDVTETWVMPVHAATAEARAELTLAALEVMASKAREGGPP